MIWHHFSAGVYVRQAELKAGQEVETHEHKYDHLAILGSGEVIVELDGEIEHRRAPCVIDIAAGKKHRIQALTDITWFCVHATDVADPEQMDRVLIKE